MQSTNTAGFGIEVREVTMKTILCYGDSNTWGYNPLTGERHPWEERWTTVLQRELGKDFLVIPEGLNGRTTVWEDPIELHKSGSVYLPPCIESHKPLDLVIIMLGTNDLKMRFSLPAEDIAKGVGVLADIVLKSSCGPDNTAPKVLVLIPPEVRKLSDFASMFAGAREKSLQFPGMYRKICGEKGVPAVEIGHAVCFSDADGIHFETDQLAVLGRRAAEEVRKIV